MAHASWDPHQAQAHLPTGPVSTSSVYQWFISVGFKSVYSVYQAALLGLCLSFAMVLVSSSTSSTSVPSSSSSSSSSSHAGSHGRSHRWSLHRPHLPGLGSLAWAGHLVHCSTSTSLSLTFLGGLSLGHHHLSLGVLTHCPWVSQGPQASSLGGLRLGPAREPQSLSHESQLQSQLATALFLAAILSVSVAHLRCPVLRRSPIVLPSAQFLLYDPLALTVHYAHHLWIASFLLLGSLAHGAISIVRDRPV